MPLFSKTLSTDIIAFTSDRSVDFSFDNDQFVLNEAQRGFLCSQLNSDLPEPMRIRQVHGDKIIVAEKSLSVKHDCPEADGLITNVMGLSLAILTADCLPVFLYDDQKDGVGLIHAGWKGGQKNIVGQAIKLMEQHWQSDPQNIRVAFGPAIRPCCYEVGSEFQEIFPENLIMRDHRYYLDLPQRIQGQLLSAGIKKANISDCNICTCCNANYFSFRREGEKAGRMISIIMIKTKAGD